MALIVLLKSAKSVKCQLRKEREREREREREGGGKEGVAESNQICHNYFDLRKYFELSAFEILRANHISNAISNLSKEV